MGNYDFYRQISINNKNVDVLVDLTREKIILQFGDDQLIPWLAEFGDRLKNYITVIIKEE